MDAEGGRARWEKARGRCRQVQLATGNWRGKHVVEICWTRYCCSDCDFPHRLDCARKYFSSYSS